MPALVLRGRPGLMTMLGVWLLAAGLLAAGPLGTGRALPSSQAAGTRPIRWDAWSAIDNQRVQVRALDAAPPAAGALPEVRVWLDGHVQYLAPGQPAEAYQAVRAVGFESAVVVVALKETRIPPRPNPTPYQLAFPRPSVRKVMENDRAIVWDYTWSAGVPTPMHFHDKEIVVTYLADGALRSTEPDGTSVVNPHYFGFTKFNPGDRTHTEELIEGRGRAVMIELKR